MLATWNKAHTLVGEIVQILEKDPRPVTDPLVFCSQPSSPDFRFYRLPSITVPHGPTPRYISETFVTFLYHLRRPEFFSSLMVHKGASQKTLKSDTLSEQTLFNKRLRYPIVRCTWTLRNHSQGFLTYLRVDLSSDTFVVYEGEMMALRGVGNSRLWGHLPKSLTPQNTVVMGTPLHWAINFETEAEKILHASELEVFHEVLIQNFTEQVA